MKKRSYIAKLGLITFWALLPWCLSAQTQGPYTGMWEGNFMEQFKTVILLDQTEEDTYAGKIIMFSGETRIQDDELSDISIENHTLSFYIEDKESSFKGTFNKENTELSGNFIFPDNSRHPLTVRKYNKDSSELETSEPSLKEKLKEDLKHSFPVEELKSDFHDLIDKLKKYHPRLYSYTSQTSFEEQAEEILSGMNSDLNMEQFYKRIAPLLASVGCGHTGIRMPHDYQNALFEQGHFFPFKLYVSDKRAYFISAPGHQGENLAPGSEIFSINKMPVDQIIEELLTIIPSEGSCMSTRYQELNRDFQSYFHLLDPSEHFLLELSAEESKAMVEVDACQYSVIHPTGANNMPLRSFSFHLNTSPEIGVLAVSSFGIRNMEKYFAFLDSTFRIMEDVPNLLLDLRDNHGGHPIFAAQLFSYLTNNDFTYFQRNPDVEDFEPLYNTMEPNQLHYKGNIYVLVNGSCLSTTGHLISLLQYHTEAIFVGEQPGSTFRCNDFSIQFQLPNTGMELNIPRTTFMTAVEGYSENKPFPLDYRVNIAAQDIIEGTDKYQSFVYELINEKNSRP